MAISSYKAKEVLIDHLEIGVHVAKKGCIADLKNTHQSILTIFIEVRHPPGSSKELFLQLTDKNDPLVLFSTIVTESDYQSMCSNQPLLADFADFPLELTDLVKKCHAEKSKDNPTFLLLLRCNGDEFPPDLSKSDSTAFLEIIQVNKLTQLCHLSFHLTSASLQSKLSHISLEMKSLKNALLEKKQESQDRENNLSLEVERLQGLLSKKDTENQNLQKKFDEERGCQLLKHDELIKKEKEKLLQMKSDHDRATSRMKREHQLELDKLQSSVSNLNKKNSTLTKNVNKLSGDLRNVKHQIKVYEEKLSRYKNDLCKLQEMKESLENDLDDRASAVDRLHSEKVKLNSALIVKGREVEELVNQMKEMQSRMALLDQCEEHLRRKEEELNKLQKEFNKSLHIIKNFDAHIKKLTVKVSEKEEILCAKEKELEEKINIIKSLGRCVKEKEDINEECKLELKRNNEKIEDLIKTINTNESLTALLRQQLAEAQAKQDLVRRAPLAEAYLPSFALNKHQPLHGLTTSTPISANSTPATHLKEGQLSDVMFAKSLSRISGGVSANKDTKENEPEGLDNEYLEPTQRTGAPKQRGLLRSESAPVGVGGQRPVTRGATKAIRPTRGGRRSDGGMTRGRGLLNTRASSHLTKS